MRKISRMALLTQTSTLRTLKSLHLVRSLIKEKHNILELNTDGYCKPNQGSLYNHLIKEQYDAPDAPEDVRALRKILFDPPFNLSKKNIVENSSVTSISHAIESILHLDQRNEFLQTFSENCLMQATTD